MFPFNIQQRPPNIFFSSMPGRSRERIAHKVSEMRVERHL
jgi:hypothetical protein